MFVKITSPMLFSPAIIAVKKTNKPSKIKKLKNLELLLNNFSLIILMLVVFTVCPKQIKFFITKNKNIDEIIIVTKLNFPLPEKNTMISFPEANPAPIIEPKIKKIKPKFKYFTKYFINYGFDKLLIKFIIIKTLVHKVNSATLFTFCVARDFHFL